MPCKLYKKIESAPVSPSYIINRIAFLLHHLFTVHYLLLEKKRYELTFFCKMILGWWGPHCYGLKNFIVRILAYDDVIMALFCLFLRKMPLFHYLNHYKVAKNDPLTLKCGLKLALISFFKNQLGIFDFDCHRKVGSAQNTTFWIKKWCSKNAPWR